MDIQQVFDTVLSHLWQQNAPAAINAGTHCCYWDVETGRKCAIGCLIPSEYYHYTMEGHAIDGILEGFPNLMEIPAIRAIANYVGDPQLGPLSFGNDLQKMHDGLASVRPEDFRFFLRKVAEDLATRYNLTVNLPTEE